MSNFFTHHANIERQIFDLMHQIHCLQVKDDCERRHYMEQLRNLIRNKPNLTAAHLAALMTDDPDERERIKVSIGGLGYAAEDSKRKHPSIKNPSMPELKRKRTTITRHFVELAEDNSVIGEYKVEERKYIYSIGD